MRDASYAWSLYAFNTMPAGGNSGPMIQQTSHLFHHIHTLFPHSGITNLEAHQPWTDGLSFCLF